MSAQLYSNAMDKLQQDDFIKKLQAHPLLQKVENGRGLLYSEFVQNNPSRWPDAKWKRFLVEEINPVYRVVDNALYNRLTNQLVLDLSPRGAEQLKQEYQAHQRQAGVLPAGGAQAPYVPAPAAKVGVPPLSQPPLEGPR